MTSSVIVALRSDTGNWQALNGYHNVDSVPVNGPWTEVYVISVKAGTVSHYVLQPTRWVIGS